MTLSLPVRPLEPLCRSRVPQRTTTRSLIITAVRARKLTVCAATNINTPLLLTRSLSELQEADEDDTKVDEAIGDLAYESAYPTSGSVVICWVVVAAAPICWPGSVDH